MKIITTLIVFLSFSAFTYAQIPVDTLQHNKNVLIEEFTGVQCNSCPQGHIEISNLIAAYPNRVYAAGMHSYSTGHTTPYGTDEDLRRYFPDDLRTKIPDLWGIPGGIMSRRASTAGKECYTFWPFNGFHQPIDSAVNVIMNEASPFNVGVEANYDTVNKILTVNAQVYTTTTKTSTYKLNVFLTQSNIIADQLNGNTVIPNYNHQHVFREVVTPTWGATMYPSGTSQGDIFNSTVTFANSVKNYKMDNVEVLVFVTDHSITANSKGHVVQVKGMHVTMTGATSVSELSKVDGISVYPNPSSNQFYVHLINPSLNNEVIISDINGKTVLRKQVSNENNFYVNHSLAPGVYFLSLKNNPGVVKKLVVQ